MEPNQYYESRFETDKWSLDDRPIMFIDMRNHLCLNKTLVDNINNSSMSHEIWLSDECLAIYFNESTKTITATWVSFGSPYHGKKITWSWVEKLYKPKEDKRAIKVSIEGYRDFVYVFHLIPENCDYEYSIRRGVWPD